MKRRQTRRDEGGWQLTGGDGCQPAAGDILKGGGRGKL